MHDSAMAPSTPPSNSKIIPSNILFPVIGIGASAGGLDALLQLFENLPSNNGMAFVVVLHLSPKHQSMADQILQRVTSMPVLQVVQPVLIEPEHVYVIAPNMQLSMVDGFLSVAELERPRGAHIAIDIFFRTLAEVHSERAVAVVLSGTGSDGAVGLTRVKEQGGVTIVQEPGDAEHDGMPQAAIRTGIVDFVLPVAEIPQKLIDLWQNARQIELPPTGDGEAPIAHLADGADTAAAEKALQQVVVNLLAHSGHDFRHYKRATVLRRIERRMQVRAVATLPEYCALLESDDTEHKLLLSDMLISVTNFFRDRESFEAVEREIIQDLFKDKTAGDEVRVWVTACASGEEAYSFAILLADQAAQMSKPPSFQVFASDIDENAVNIARIGSYPASIITDVPPVRLRQHFSNDGGRYRIRKNVRDRILFTEHNLLRDPPFSRLDMISCRNLLIYLNRDIQAKVLEMFHFALNPGGYLFLGNSESAESVSEFFTPVDKKNRIYRARLTARGASSHGYMAVGPKRPADMPVRKPMQAQFSYADVHQRALAQLAPPSLVLDRESNIVHSSTEATRFLRIAGGEPSRNVLALIIPELRLELRSAIFQAQQSGTVVACRPLAVPHAGGEITVEMSVMPFHDEDSAADFMLIMFRQMVYTGNEDLPRLAIDTDQVVLSQLEAELQLKKDLLQETIEQAEVSTEELRASNEELQAINEELRSATEELETSKEELQSLNEELITVNYELKVKVEETGKANDDLNNLIAATDIATVFVDSGLRIKRFTPRATDIFSIIGSDVGRSLLDLTHRLDYADLAQDVGLSFDSLQVVEREVRSNDGRCFIARLLPYRTTEDRIEGAVLTFFDISARRIAEERLQARETRMRLVAESTRDYAIITTDAEGRVVSWNKGAELVFGYTEEEISGHDLDRLYSPEDRVHQVRQEEMRRSREEGRAEDERWHVRKDGRRVFCNGVTTPLGPAATYGYAKIARDETARELSKCELDQALTAEQKNRSEAENEVALKDEFLAIMSHELRHPLNLIHVNTELMARLPEVLRSHSASHAIRQVRTAVISQAKIIEDLLDMSRVRTGKLALSAAPVDINELVMTLADAIRADHAASGVVISVVSLDHPVMVFADSVRIEQVFMNLMSNAVKFSPPKGVIEVVLSHDDNEACISVSDTGQGISADFLPKVFDMFGQAGSATTRSKGGLGIGLALVREIVNLHGGRVIAQSDGAGMGARFSVWLPLFKDHATLIAANDAAPPHGIDEARVLLVDDAEDLVVAFKSLLELEGAAVIVATNASEGLATLENNEIDVVISDISMPGMDGYAFLEAARRLPRYAHVPAVALSGLARESDIARARQAGFSAHLTKPVSVDKLIATLRELLKAPG
jgi:two-component system CheB/CheR fusion protein